MEIVHFNKKYAKELAKLWLSPEVTKYTLSTKKRTTPKRIAEKFKSKKSNAFVALEKGKVIGFTSMKTFEGRRNHCCDFVIFVTPTHQGQGIGKKLMKKILTTAKSKKLKRIELGVFSDNLKAIKLYEKFGFVKEGIRKKSLQRDSKLYDEIIMAKLF